MTGHVQDLWTMPGPNGRRVKGPRHGKGKRWQARWIDNGAEKARAFDSKDAALAHLARIAVHGPDLPRPKVTFGEYADTWLASQLHHRAHTVSALATINKHMWKPELGRLPIAGVTRMDVQNAVTEWSSHYAPATVAQAYGYTRTVFAAAVFDKLIPETPCVRISVPQQERKRIVPLTPEQVKSITEAMPAHLKAAVTLAAATGLRIGEIGGLGLRHLNDGVVSVERQLVDTHAGVPVFGPPKTNGSIRDVSMGTVAWDAIQAHLKAHRNQHGLVFGTSRGTPLERRRASQTWRSVTRGLDLPDDTGWHALRHFHASALVSSGLSLRAVADRLGHSSLRQMDTYAHLFGRDDDRSVSAIDSILRSDVTWRTSGPGRA